MECPYCGEDTNPKLVENDAGTHKYCRNCGLLISYELTKSNDTDENSTITTRDDA